MIRIAFKFTAKLMINETKTEGNEMTKVFVRYILASNIFPKKKEEISVDATRLGYLTARASLLLNSDKNGQK